MALIGNLLKPLYWDRVEDALRRHSDFGAGPEGGEDSTGLRWSGEGFVTRSGFERFRAEVRDRYARSSEVDFLRKGLQANDDADLILQGRMALSASTVDSLARRVPEEYLSRVQADSLLGGFVREDRFAALQGIVQGLHRVRTGGGMAPTPAGRPVFRRRNLWKGYHLVHPPYAARAGGAP